MESYNKNTNYASTSDTSEYNKSTSNICKDNPSTDNAVHNNTITFDTKTGIRITVYLTEDNIVRVISHVIGEEYSEIPFKILKSPVQCDLTDGEFFSVGDFIIRKEDKGYSLYDSEEKLLYQSEIEIIYDKNGTFVAIESEWDRVGLVQTLEEKRTYYNKENFYGMGEASDSLLLNNHQFKLYHTADLGNQELMYIPFYFTNKGYATYYNANGNDIMEFIEESDSTRTVTYNTKKLYFDCYMYYETAPKACISRFYSFSGSKSFIPLWAFGYIQSKFGYENEEEIYHLLELIDKYNVPVSAIVIDFHWYKRMGDLEWNLERFPHYIEMCETLKKRNIKLLTITQPYYTKDCKHYQEFDENAIFAKRIKEVSKPQTMVWGDWWCGDSLYGSIINPIAEGASERIGQKYIELKEKGLDGFWLDLGEPENVPPQTYFNQYPEEEFHLYFCNEWIKIIHDSVAKAFPEERLFILSRCGYTGTAGYNVSIWSGDSSSTFKNLEKQITIGINSGLTGYSYWGSDAGGFLSQLKLPEEELYIRWMQFACFTPIFRTHGKKTPREPWSYGEETTSLMLNLLNTRYQLLPYIYSSAYQTFKQGIPMMRPMFLENPEDSISWEIKDQYYFGDNLLIAPIYKTISEENVREVYLPEGNWYDYYTLSAVESGTINVDSVIDKIPIYIKEGAILVQKDVILVTESEKESSYTWYMDDGVTNDYLNGRYEEITITLKGDNLYFANVKEEKVINIKYVRKNNRITELTGVKLNKGDNIINL